MGVQRDEFAAKQVNAPKTVFHMADEGEPGTFKDRVLMNMYPGLMIEGMIMAAADKKTWRTKNILPLWRQEN